jgi:two-component sensor histidine kinase
MIRIISFTAALLLLTSLTGFAQEDSIRRSLLSKASAWSNLADHTNPASVVKKEEYYQRAVDLYRLGADTLHAMLVLKNMADFHLVSGRPEQAERELLVVLKGLKTTGYRRLHYTYDLLRASNKLKGDLVKEVYYAGEMVRSLERSDSLDHLLGKALLYGYASDSYTRAGMYEHGIDYARLSLQWMLRVKTDMDFGYVYYNNLRLGVWSLLKLDSAKQALAFIAASVRNRPPANPVEQSMVACIRGACYIAIGNYKKAESQFSQLLAGFGGDLVLRRQPYPTENCIEDMLALGNLYFLTGRFDKAEVLAKRLIPRKEDLASLEQWIRIERFRSQVDSALGRTLSAFRHYQSYKALTDSLYGVQKMVQIQELQIKYATEQKDKDLRIQAGDIRLLTKQSQLQLAEADKSRILRNVMIGGLLALGLLAGVVLNRYRLKQRTTARLQRLLEENDWLMREIHHRVKNNLQVVMSLLNSQTAYMKDPVAISAVMESRHRVQAMSLIHQKLYKSAEVSSVDMSEYIAQLVDYLQDSFDGWHKVDFHLEVSPVILDVSQAVPLGLILNEAISNSYKYAFPGPGPSSDAITLRLTVEAERTIRLFIGDNGRGLPPGIRFASSDYFGLSLIRGLAGDLEARLDLCDANGTGYYLSFTAMSLL